MFPIYEISAAPHLPYTLRGASEANGAASVIESVETDVARELLADGIILAVAVN